MPRCYQALQRPRDLTTGPCLRTRIPPFAHAQVFGIMFPVEFSILSSGVVFPITFLMNVSEHHGALQCPGLPLDKSPRVWAAVGPVCNTPLSRQRRRQQPSCRRSGWLPSFGGWGFRGHACCTLTCAALPQQSYNRRESAASFVTNLRINAFSLYVLYQNNVRPSGEKARRQLGIISA